MKGTARLLGWTDAARAWAAEAVSIALGEERLSSGGRPRNSIEAP